MNRRDYYENIYATSADGEWDAAPGKEVILNALARLRCLGRLGEGLDLVDIGSGTGYLLGRIKAEIAPDWTLHGVDFAAPAVERGRQLHPGIELHCEDGAATHFADGSFDVVVSYGSIEHFPKPPEALVELARILRPGGIFLVMLPSLDIYRTDRDDEGWYEDLTGQPQWNFTRDTWERHFRAAGLALWETRRAGAFGAMKPGVFFLGDKPAS